MNLLGMELSKAGLAFISAKAVHHDGGMRVEEVVCATAEDAARVDRWARSKAINLRARVATAIELAEHERFAF